MTADWCPACREQTALTDKGICLWCDTPLEQRPRGGWTRPDLKAKITDAHLRALHVIYQQHGQSINQLAQQVYQRLGYRSHHSCARAIHAGWERLGLQRRDRIEAVKLACTIHGLAPKHGPRPGYQTYKRRQHTPDQPLCAGIRRNPPGRGEPCRRPAVKGSRYCVAHDPDRQLSHAEQLARMRAGQVARQPTLPLGPFAAWLRMLRDEHGSYRAVANLVGLEPSQCHRYSRGQDTSGREKATITVAVVERCAAAAGSSIDAIYGCRVAA